MARKRILFSGYAHVHFVCFLPVYQQLVTDDRVEITLSGGFKSGKGDDVRFSIDGFYDPFPVDPAHVLEPSEIREQDFDVVVCAHLSDTLFPRSAGKSVQIFHGVSFKNLAVREKALRYDFLCLPGSYHADQYVKQGLVDSDSKILVTGFAKVDQLVSAPRPTHRLEDLGLDPARPTLLLAPTGDKYNAMETMGRAVIEAIRAHGAWNLMVKPHDHPKRAIDWFSELSDLEGDGVALIRDTDVAPYLSLADLLMTDASSVALEYTLLDRPILFLDVPKLLERLERRAPALDLDTFGRKIGTVVERADQVVDAIAAGLADPGARSAIRRQAASHLFHQPGHAAERIAGVVLHAAGLEPQLPAGVLQVDEG